MVEKELIAQCQKKDRNAFQQLYTTYNRKLMGVAMRYCIDVSEAEDVLQESFIKIFRQIDNYQGTGSFEGWLRRIVVHTSINHYNSRKVRVDGGGDADNYDIPDGNLNIEHQMHARELMEIIEQLPEGYRYVFNMNVIEGYTHKEIAEQLGITEGTSKSQLAKAKALLRKILISRKMVA